MTTKAVGAIGTLLQKGDGASPEVFTTIAEVKTITGPAQSTQLIDVTSHSSPSGYKEYIPSFKDGGSVKLGLNFIANDPTLGFTSSGLRYDFENRIRRNYRIQFTNHDQVDFGAYVENFEPSADVNSALAASTSLRTTGAVVWSTWS